jgi:hypothetical protein
MIDGDKLAGQLFADGSPVDLVERYGAEGQPPLDPTRCNSRPNPATASGTKVGLRRWVIGALPRKVGTHMAQRLVLRAALIVEDEIGLPSA